MLLVLAGSLLAFALALAAVIALRPEWIVTPANLERAARWSEGSTGVRARWKDLGVRITVPAPRSREFNLRFRELCVSQQPNEACFADAELGFVLRFWPLPVAVTRAGPLTLAGGKVDYRSRPPDPAEKKPPSPSGGAGDGGLRDLLAAFTRGGEGLGELLSGLPLGLEHAQLAPVRIEVNEAVVRTPERRYQGRLHLRGDAREVRATAEETKLRTKAQLLARIPERIVDLKAGGALAPGVRATADLQIRPAGRERVRYRATVDYRGAERIEAQASGELGARAMTARFSGVVKGLHRELPELRLRDCELGTDRLPGDAELATRLRCPVTVRVPRREFSQLRTPPSADLTVLAALRAKLPFSTEQPLNGSLSVALDRVTAQMIVAEGRIDATVAGRPAELLRGEGMRTRVNAFLRVPEFHKLVALLEDSPYALPAPFNVLKGELRAGVQGESDLVKGAFPVFLQTRLSSPAQRLDLDGEGRLALAFGQPERPPHLDLEVLLSDVALVMPRLELSAPPQFLPDSRIKVTRSAGSPAVAASAGRPRGQGGEAAAPAFSYAIRVRTPGGEPLRLISNLARAPVPIDLDLKFADEDAIAGALAVKSFPVKFFRQEASVERLRVSFDPKTKERKLDGQIRVAYTDYTLRILLLGTVDEPIVKLESDPPMPERQLLAALLFGRSADQLDPSESESVGSASAALTDGALNLASLYLLASTPVESVNYDPQSGIFNAKVRLGEGTSLNVGTGSGEVAQVGIRRRLSRFWTITTNLSDVSSTSGGSVTAYLEWSHRY